MYLLFLAVTDLIFMYLSIQFIYMGIAYKMNVLGHTIIIGIGIFLALIAYGMYKDIKLRIKKYDAVKYAIIDLSLNNENEIIFTKDIFKWLKQREYKEILREIDATEIVKIFNFYYDKNIFPKQLKIQMS